MRVTCLPPHKRIPECLLLGECRIGNRLGILGKWASRQPVGLSHAGSAQMEQDEEEDGRPVQQPLSQPQSQAPGLFHTRGRRLRSLHTSTLDLVEQYARR